MDPEPQRVTVNGTRFYVEVHGEGPPMVLIHSGLTDSRMWNSQVGHLSRDHTVVRYDLRGYGRTDLPSGSFAHADDLRSLLNHLGIQRTVLVGASLGGKIAIDFSLEHPEMVEGIVLLDPALGGHRWSDLVREKWKAVGDAAEAGDIDQAVALEIRMWVDGPGRSPDEVDPAVRRAVFEMNGEVFRREMEEEGLAEELEIDPPAAQRLNELRVPTLVIVGEHDLPDMLDIADQIVSEVRGARKVVVPAAAHLPSMERPREVNGLIREWLSE